MTGRLIVIDGLDGTGKTTQSARVADVLKARGYRTRLISFPDYNEPSSALVRMYLGGEFCEDPDGVGAYAASSFYAVDRYASFKRFWEADYREGAVIIATRYVSANAIHQMGKLPREEWDGFLEWLSDYEYDKLGLPRPDQVIFLDMERSIADELLLKRYGGDREKEDIHERDKDYLRRCQETARYAAEKEGWTVIDCGENGVLLPIETITERILAALQL